MRNAAIITLSAIVLSMQALPAHAEDGGTVTPPAIGTANPGPPAAGSDVGTPPPQKPALNGNNALGTNGNVVDNQAAGPVATDTSTAAPGGQAESSRNGALSSPPEGKPVQPDHQKKKPAADEGGDTPK